jgi:hypothetical protein
MGSEKSDKNVNVIGCSTNGDRNSSDGFETTAEERVQTAAPIVIYKRYVVLGMKDEMVMEREVCLGHGMLGLAAPLTGCG